MSGHGGAPGFRGAAVDRWSGRCCMKHRLFTRPHMERARCTWLAGPISMLKSINIPLVDQHTAGRQPAQRWPTDKGRIADTWLKMAGLWARTGSAHKCIVLGIEEGGPRPTKLPCPRSQSLMEETQEQVRSSWIWHIFNRHASEM